MSAPDTGTRARRPSATPSSSLHCPRCAAPLKCGRCEHVEAELCRACSGLLLHRSGLASVLEVLAVEHYPLVAADLNLPEVADDHPEIDCPVCAVPMERYGYMGSRKVMIDGCGRCERVWLDARELVAMVRMYVQLDKRADRHLRAGPLSDIVGTHMNAQAAATMMLMAFALL